MVTRAAITMSNMLRLASKFRARPARGAAALAGITLPTQAMFRVPPPKLVCEHSFSVQQFYAHYTINIDLYN